MKKAIILLSLALIIGYLTGLIYDYTPFKTANESLSYISEVIIILLILGAIYNIMKQIFKMR